jgi:hypothetical protein
MTYIVWYNTLYEKQFEAVVSRDEWQKAKVDYGERLAAGILVSECYKVKSKKNVTKKRDRAASGLIIGSLVRPDIFGPAIIKVGRNKKEVLDRGHSELIVSSTKKALHKYHMHPKTRRHVLK